MQPVIRAFSFATIAALVICGFGCASTAATDKPAPRPARINHLAFFKLKDPADAAALIADCDAGLAVLPMVRAYFCGGHLDTGRGDAVDSNYDVGFYVGFATEADYAAYVRDPAHEALVAKWKPRWEWIRVLDVLDDSP